MFPRELTKIPIEFPATTSHSMLIVTLNGLRHKRFAYRLQKEFGESVLAWYELDSSIKPVNTKAKPVHTSKSGKINSLKKRLQAYLQDKGIIEAVKRSFREVHTWYKIRKYYSSQQKIEQELFEKEIEQLKPFAHLKPIKIHPSEVHSEDFLAQVKKLDPYFFLSLGGPLFKKKLLEAIRGAAINQHAGHSPVYKGNNTIAWALYHRNLSYVSSTVHVTVTGADAGPILRRSSPCMFPTDQPATIFARVVALGTELMIEVIEDIIMGKEIMAFEQSPKQGRTYLNKDFNKNILSHILTDFQKGWLSKALFNQKNF